MDKKEALKLAKEAGLSEDAIKAIGINPEQDKIIVGLKEDVDSEKAKNGGITADKHKFKERAEKAEKELLSEKEKDLDADTKYKLEIQRATDAAEKTAKDFADFKAEGAKKDRELSLVKIGADVEWLDSVPKKMRALAVKDAFLAVEDLGNETKVAEAFKTFSESNATLLKAEVAKGGGGGKEVVVQKQAGGNDKPQSHKDICDEAWQK
jgi:hypothetical protein